MAGSRISRLTSSRHAGRQAGDFSGRAIAARSAAGSVGAFTVAALQAREFASAAIGGGAQLGDASARPGVTRFSRLTSSRHAGRKAGNFGGRNTYAAMASVAGGVGAFGKAETAARTMAAAVIAQATFLPPQSGRSVGRLSRMVCGVMAGRPAGTFAGRGTNVRQAAMASGAGALGGFGKAEIAARAMAAQVIAQAAQGTTEANLVAAQMAAVAIAQASVEAAALQAREMASAAMGQGGVSRGDAIAAQMASIAAASGGFKFLPEFVSIGRSRRRIGDTPAQDPWKRIGEEVP